MGRPVTLRDVAARAGVSSRTVSNVVNGYAPVTEATRARVQQAVDELGYRPNVLARNLATGRSGQIAVVVPYLDTPYFAELLQGVIRAARVRGYNVLIDQTEGDAEHEKLFLTRGSQHLLFDGVIFSPLGLAQSDLSVRDASLPLVVLGERVSDGSFDHIGIEAHFTANLRQGLVGGRRQEGSKVIAHSHLAIVESFVIQERLTWRKQPVHSFACRQPGSLRHSPRTEP